MQISTPKIQLPSFLYVFFSRYDIYIYIITYRAIVPNFLWSEGRRLVIFSTTLTTFILKRNLDVADLFKFRTTSLSNWSLPSFPRVLIPLLKISSHLGHFWLVKGTNQLFSLNKFRLDHHSRNAYLLCVEASLERNILILTHFHD